MMVAAALDWGSVPAWFTAGAAFVALLGYLAGRRDRSREQAEMVYVLPLHFRTSTAERRGHVEFVVVNDSTAPAYDVQAHLFASGRRRQLWWLMRSASKWWTGERRPGAPHFAIVAPGSRTEPDTLEVPWGSGEFERGSVLPNLGISYRDALGRRWVRWPDGRLSRWRRLPARARRDP